MHSCHCLQLQIRVEDDTSKLVVKRIKETIEKMDLGLLLQGVIPSWSSVAILATFFAYLAIIGSILPGEVVPGVTLQDGSRLYYRCNGLFSMLLLIVLLAIGARMDFISPTAIAEKGLELLSTTFIFSCLVTLALYAAGSKSRNQSSSLKPHLKET